MNNQFYIPGNPMALVGELLQCTKCQRKILVQMGLNGTVHHFGTSVTCAECLVVAESFRKDNPGVAEQLDEWKKS